MSIKQFKKLIFIIFFIFCVNSAYLAAAEKEEKPVNLMNNLQVSYESNTEATKTTVNVLKYYLQLFGPVDLNNSLSDAKIDLAIIEAKKEQFLSEREKVEKLRSNSDSTPFEQRIDEITKKRDDIDFKLDGAEYNIIYEEIKSFKKYLNGYNINITDETIKKNIDLKKLSKDIKSDDLPENITEKKRNNTIKDVIQEVYKFMLKFKKNQAALITLQNDKLNRFKEKIKKENPNLKEDELDGKIEADKEIKEVKGIIDRLTVINNDINNKFSDVDALIGYKRKLDIKITEYNSLKKDSSGYLPVPYYLPLNVFISSRLAAADSFKLKNAFNSDFINPVGGTVTFQEYFDYYPFRYSSANQYWTLSLSLSQSWLHYTGIDNKNYEIGAFRGNIDLRFIFPVLDENLLSSAGKIQLGAGFSYGHFLGKKNVKEIYELCNSESPNNHAVSARLNILVNLTNFLSFSAEYLIPFGLDKKLNKKPFHTDKKLDHCIYLSSTLTRI